MKTLLISIALLCPAAPLSGQTANQPPAQKLLSVWMNANAPAQTRLDALFPLVQDGQSEAALYASYAANPRAVSDALAFSFEHGHAGHQCLALQLAIGMQDRASYARMIEPALRSPEHEVRSIALGAAAIFDDRSEVVVSGIVAEIGNTNPIAARDNAFKLAANWNLPEAVAPLLSLVTHTNVTWASMAAGSLSAYAYLPAEALPKLEAALARAEYKATNMVRYTNTALIPPQSHAWAVDGLVVALRKAKEKAQLPAPPGMEQAKAVNAAKKTAKSTVVGKASPADSPAAQENLPTSGSNPGETGRTNLLVFLGLASLAVIAWFLVKGRLR